MLYNVVRKAFEVTPHPFRRKLVTVMVTSALLALFDAALVIVVGPLVTAVVGNSQPQLFDIAVDGRLLVIVTGAVLVLKNILQIVVSRWKQNVLFDLQTYFSSEAFRAVLVADYRRSGAFGSGKKASYVITEPLQTVLNVHTHIISFTTELSLILFVSLSLLVVNPLETVAIFAVLGTLIGSFQLVTRSWLRRSGERRRDADVRRQEMMRAIIDSESDVRAMGWVEKLLALYAVPNRVSSAMTSNKAFATEIVKNIVELAVICGVGLLAIGASRFSLTEIAPMLATFAAAAYRLAPSFNRLMVCSQSIRFGAPSLDVLCEMLPIAAQKGPNSQIAQPQPEIEIRVEVDDLPAPSGATLARDIRLVLRRGDVLVVNGPSGIGKSTLLKALVDGAPGVRIYSNGALLGGGLAHAGFAVGMVGQRPLVLPGTLGMNILPDFAHGASGTKVAAGSFESKVLGSLADRHEGSVINESVVADNLLQPISVSNLSGGQAQRIALMRALLLGTDLLLLDEPTSALDTASRDRFVELLRAISSSRIVIIISHDPSLGCVANRTLTLSAQT